MAPSSTILKCALAGLSLALAAGCSSSSGGDNAGDAGHTAPTTFPANSSNESCQATVTQGGLTGKMSGSNTCDYLGIPYGAPPTGTLRFMPPTPAANWTGTRDATTFGPSCLQGSSALGPVASSSEDCLSVNVYTPRTTPAAGLPVMAFIYGGAFTSGSSSLYDGTGLAEAGPAVVVTMNYRLGALGFLSHPAIDAARPGAPSGSDGIRDQQLALKWIQDNILSFHGDPGNVTVFGESAGSMSTCMHLVSPGSQGLANRYIMESGACVGKAPLLTSHADGYTIGGELAAQFCSGSADVLSCLQAAPPDMLMTWLPPAGTATGVNSLLGNLLGPPFSPTVEGAGGVLPDLPATLVSQGKFNKDAAILAGTNKNEWGLFVDLAALSGSSGPNLNITTAAQLNAGLEAFYGSAAPQVEAQYPATDATAAQTFVDLITDYAFRCPTRDLARSTMMQGTKAYYIYSYEVGPAWHSFELVPLFNVTELAILGAATPSAGYTKQMLGYWSQFATSGNPNGPASMGAPMWPQYTLDGEEYLQLLDPTPAANTKLKQAQCDFWDAFTPAPSTGVPVGGVDAGTEAGVDAGGVADGGVVVAL